MHWVPVEEAASSLHELIRKACSGEDVVITGDHEPLVRLVPVNFERRPRVFGSAAGLIEMAADFDAPLEEFEEDR